MSTTPKSKPSPLMQIALGAVILAAITAYYLFLTDGRKAGEKTGDMTAAITAESGAQEPAVPGGVSRSLATGSMAAFLVKSERKPLKDSVFQDGAGKAVKLSDWKGKVVLLNLWATWCAPCRKEMPDLAMLQKEMGSDQFEVVAVSVDRKGAEASSAFLKETGADALKLYVEPTTAIVADFGAAGLPSTLLIDRQGNEIGRLLGPANWASPEAKALITTALAEKN